MTKIKFKYYDLDSASFINILVMRPCVGWLFFILVHFIFSLNVSEVVSKAFTWFLGPSSWEQMTLQQIKYSYTLCIINKIAGKEL